MLLLNIFCTLFLGSLYANEPGLPAISTNSIPTTEETVITRELDPTYVLSAISGAVSAISDRKTEKHPDEIHPISVLATILQQTSKLVRQEVDKEKRKQENYRSIPGIHYEAELKILLDLIDQEQKENKALKKLSRYTKTITTYSEKTDIEKEAYFQSLCENRTDKKKLIGDIFFLSGNFIANQAQKTAETIAESLYSLLQQEDKYITTEKTIRSIEGLSYEAALIDLVETLVDYGQTKRDQDVNKTRILIIDQLISISVVIEKILLQDEELSSFWRETPIIGKIIALETTQEKKELIESYVQNEETSVQFVQELVYCIYHVIFKKLGTMLSIAYQTLQDPIELTFNDEEAEVLFEDETIDLEI